MIIKILCKVNKGKCLHSDKKADYAALIRMFAT